MNHFGVELDLIRNGVGGFHVKRDVIRVFGAAARTFLQGQLSRDVGALAPGRSHWVMLLSTDGRVEALLRVWGGNGPAEILLDTETGLGSLVVQRLNRHRGRTKVEIELLAWEMLALRGPAAAALADGIRAQLRDPRDWSRFPGVDLLGPTITVPDDLHMISHELLEALRVADEWPGQGNEILGPDPAPLPDELGERVVRLARDPDGSHDYGGEPAGAADPGGAGLRRLVRLDLTTGEPPAPGTLLEADGGTVLVTSSSHALDGDGTTVLALIGGSIPA